MGAVRILRVKFVPGPEVRVVTMFPATKRFDGLVVVTEPELLEELVDEEAAVTSSGLTVSIPLYSRMRMSG